MIFPMPCWMIISPAIMRSTLKARGLQAANVSIMTLPSSFLQLIRIALQCSGKVHRDNKNRRDFAKQQRNNVRAKCRRRAFQSADEVSNGPVANMANEKGRDHPGPCCQIKD